MASYRIDLILSGKSEIQKMMSQAAGSVKSGLDTIKKESGSADASLRKMGKSGDQAGSDINKGTTKATSGFSKLKSQSAGTFSTITAGASKTSTTISTGFSKATSTATAGLSKMGSVGKSALTGIGGSAKSAIDGLDTLEMGIGAVIGGFGIMEIASASWSGSTQREFNEVYLGTKMTADETERYLGTIEKIVSQVPGDDTFMNALLTSAVARETSLTAKQLEMLGNATAEYVFVSQQVMGGLNAEYQREIKDYILTGNTGLMARDGLLKNQMDILEGKSTVEERILAINQALHEEGYGTLTTTEQTAIKAEELKGRFQLAATEVGTRILPYVEKLLDFFIEMDEKTNGMSTQIMLMAGGVIALGSVFGLILKPLSTAVDKAKDLVGWFKDKLPSTKTVRVKCVKDPSCTTPTPTTTTTIPGETLTSKILGKVSQIGIPVISAAAGSLIATQGLPTVTRLGSLGMSLATSGMRGAQWVAGAGGTAASGVLGPAIMGLDLPGNPLWNLKHGKDLVDWTQFDRLKSDIGSAFDTSKKGSLGDQLNLPGWLSGKLNQGDSDKTKTPSTGSGGKTPVAGIGMGLSRGIPDLVKNFEIPKFKWPKIPDIGAIIKDNVPKIKWKIPSISQLIQQIKTKIPGLKWKIPSISQLIQQIKTKIPGLKWKIPNVSQLLNQTWQKIKSLIWKIPGAGQFLSQTWQKITKLVWKIPGASQILDHIKRMIPSFNWPWGPGPSRATVNRGITRGMSGATAPRGPLKDMVSGEINRMSGLGQGNIMGAMNNNFSGVNAFRYIADGMADNLAYQFYFGDQKSNREVWDSGLCNCYDGAQFLITEAARKMVPNARLQNGFWGSTPHTWSVIGGQNFDMAARLIRGTWDPPGGPKDDFHQFMTDIGPGLSYMGYGGHLMNPYDALAGGGNCFDMTLGIMGLASSLWGIPSRMIWGTYDGMTHVWARIGNRDYDPTRMALERTYNPPPRGPLKVNEPQGDTFVFQYNGPVYGVEDLDARTQSMVNSALEKREKKRQRFRMSG